MSFIPDDCHNIVMDCPATGVSPWNPKWISRAIPLDDLKRFRDAGATVALEFAPWHLMEREPGQVDWSLTDEQVTRCRAAGMRVLLMGPSSVPTHLPDEFYVWDIDGRPMRTNDQRNSQQTWGCLSPWNADAMDCYLGFVRALQARYRADDVQVIQCFSQEGESILPPAIPCIYDPAAIASYRDHVGNPRALPNFGARTTFEWMYSTLAQALVGLHAVYADTQWHECWSALHPVYYGPAWGASGVVDIPGLWSVILRAVNPDAAFHIAFDFFPRHRFAEEFPPLLSALSEMAVQVIAGSDWPAGLRPNTPKAIAMGLRGLLTAPLHPFSLRDTVEPGAADAFRESAELFARRP